MTPSPDILLAFVPGIMGSRLSFPQVEHLTWDPDAPWGSMRKWAAADVDEEMRWAFYTNHAVVMADDNDGALSPGEVMRGWGGVYFNGYGAFLRELDTQHLPRVTPVECFGYDWRQSNVRSADDVIAHMQRRLTDTRARRVLFLTHSMGGLVVRSAFQQNAALAAQTIGVVHVAQPVAGSVAFYRRFFTGALNDEDGGGGLAGPVIAAIFGNTPDKYAAIVCGIRGAFELLPTNAYGCNWRGSQTRKGAVTYWNGDAFDLDMSTSIPPGLPGSTLVPHVSDHILERVKEAKSFHATLGLSKHAITYAVVGNKRETDTSVFFDMDHPNAPDFVHMVRPAEGDGTVPITSAGALFPGTLKPPPFTPSVPQYEVDISEGKAHAEIYLNPDVQQLVFDIVGHLIGQAPSP